MVLKICLIITLLELPLIAAVSAFAAGIHCRREGRRVCRGVRLKRKSVFERLFIHLPYRIVSDMYSHEDFEFTENGLHLIVGEQGSGKTITLVYLLMRYKERFPEVKIRTNMKYAYEDGAIKSWCDLVFKNNGVHGEIDVLDEIQNWFNSLESKDFPVEMFQEITQQRKQRKMIIGTSQVWQRVAKPIREQVKLVYKPCTLFGCLTIVRVYKPVVDNEGCISQLKPRRTFFFVHDNLIRNSFDTYHKIKTMSLKGFKEQAASPYAYRTDTGGGGKTPTP